MRLFHLEFLPLKAVGRILRAPMVRLLHTAQNALIEKEILDSRAVVKREICFKKPFYLEEITAILLAVNHDCGPQRDLKDCNSS